MDLKTNRSNSSAVGKVGKPVLSVDEIAAKNKLALSKVEISVLKTLASLQNVGKFAHKKYNLTEEQIARILAALDTTYTSALSQYANRATPKSLF